MRSLCNPISRNRRQRVKISTRNQLKGTVKDIQTGMVNSEVTVKLPNGVEIVAVITKKSAESMGLEPGKEVYALVKATNVMIGVDD